MQLTADSVHVERHEDRWFAESMGVRVYFEGMRDLRLTVATETSAGHLPWCVGASILAAAKQRLDAEPVFAQVEVDRRFARYDVRAFCAGIALVGYLWFMSYYFMPFLWRHITSCIW